MFSPGQIQSTKIHIINFIDTPSFKEDHICQIPALQKLGYNSPQ